jgi:hypothetical protein
MALFLSACAVRTDPLTLEQNAAGARADLAAMCTQVPLKETRLSMRFVECRGD